MKKESHPSRNSISEFYVFRYRGIGVRIEDDVLVTDTDVADVLTKDVPKDIIPLLSLFPQNGIKHEE